MTGAAAEPASPAAKPKAKRARGRALGKKAAHGKAAAPGQLKERGSPAQGKALGHDKQKTAPTGAKRRSAERLATRRVHKTAKPLHKTSKPKHANAAPAPVAQNGPAAHAQSGKGKP
jgi:hypothetical protein